LGVLLALLIWFTATPGLSRNIAAAIIGVTALTFAVTSAPALLLLQRQRFPKVALLLAASAPIVWVLLMSAA
jgi:hypothetical protein